ncbi:hypothetical protein NCCP2145_05100 [Pseudarthrobacter sp. NCCP-2145]|nr:hypothetical protein GCM10017547_21830 [Pseudarthrobacter oxydans]GKV71129.1 hypothetical protein NCCP2145_05100 [Pseudarthrobacter sp. NCCP-2145]
MARRGNPGSTSFTFAAHRLRWAGQPTAGDAVGRFRQRKRHASTHGNDDGGRVTERRPRQPNGNCTGVGFLDHLHHGGR